MLGTLASKVDVCDEAVGVKVIRKNVQATATNFIPTRPIDGENWWKPVIQNLVQLPSTMTIKEFN